MTTLFLIALSWPVLGLVGMLVMYRLGSKSNMATDARVAARLGWYTFAFSLYALWDKYRKEKTEEDWRGE